MFRAYPRASGAEIEAARLKLISEEEAAEALARERARNEVIFNFQGNRNPFIDHPEWATQALFTSAKPATCQLAN